MRSRRIPLTEAEKAANVAAGLTPTGRIPARAADDARRIKYTPISKRNQGPVGRVKQGNGKGEDYPPNDYRARGSPFTVKRKNDYVRVVRETGEEPLARAEVGVSYHTVKDHMVKDPQFRDAVDEAYRQHASIYAREMLRRGVEGVAEPVFGSAGKDMGTGIVGYIQRYSDRLLIEQAKRFNKEYTPRQVVEQTTKLEGRPSLGLEALSPESREDLRRILEREAQRVPAESAEPEPEADDGDG